MKVSQQNLDSLLGTRMIARHKEKGRRSLDQYFKEPIIHREIQGDRIFVPLNLEKVWNGL